MKFKLTKGPVFYVTLMIIVLAFIGCEDKLSQESAVTQNATAPETKDRSPSPDGSQTAEDAFREGTSFGRRGQYEKAVQAYSKAIELNPKYTKAYTFRGLTYLELGNFTDAIKDLDKVIALDPTAYSYRTRADVYARNGYLDKAIMDYDKVLELNTRSASGYRNRAIAYGEKRDYKKAIRDITRAIQLEPKDPQWWFDRAMLKAKRGDYDAAMIDAETALDLLGGVPNLRPGEERAVSEIKFNCMRLIDDLEKAGAKRSRQ
jgi:tetratricopeptide (TPR) repeat protein